MPKDSMSECSLDSHPYQLSSVLIQEMISGLEMCYNPDIDQHKTLPNLHRSLKSWSCWGKILLVLCVCNNLAI